MDAKMREIVDNIKQELMGEVEKMEEANRVMEVSGTRHKLPLTGRTLDMVYYPVEGKAPLFIGFYGGGFLFGGCAMNDYMWKAISEKLHVNVASIGYRKSPHHMWRDVVADGYESAVYLRDHAAEFGFDPEQISLIGGSAGASLATRTALYANMQGDMFFKNQLLMYPFLDLATDPLSKGRGSLEGPIMYVFNELHCGDDDPTLSLISPVYASVEELRGMPNTVIVLAENDNLRAEGEKYGNLLAEADVPVHMTCMEGMPHGFFESGFGVRGEELEFLGEDVLRGMKDGSIPAKAEESIEFIRKYIMV
ncbi:MAG: alpha/beta hydrolase [Clostridiales bacterium]|nr:alpha/beta hydrolase [Clostridiales bacterium]